MRDVNGWVVGTLGAAALVGAFYLGGRVTASPAAGVATPVMAGANGLAPGGIEFGCAPGQRVVMREATATSAPSATCVDPAMAPALGYAALPAAYAPAATAMPVAYAPMAQPAVQRTVVNEPLEVYRPRALPVSYQSVRQPVRTKTKSAVIIGSSAAVGATIGGLTKGKKGALIGGLLGGGAATVWDQVTRRQGGR